MKEKKERKLCGICSKPFSNFDAIGRYDGKDCHSDCYLKLKCNCGVLQFKVNGKCIFCKK